MLPPLSDDPRLDEAIDLFNRGSYEEAADIAEELYYEATGDERPLARVLLQFFVGMVHVDQGQAAPAMERLRVGLDAAATVTTWLGIDAKSIVEQMSAVVRHLERGTPAGSPRILRSR